MVGTHGRVDGLGFTLLMAGFDEVMARVANDARFADAVRSDPTNALRGYRLDPTELVRLEHALGASPGSPGLFATSTGQGAAAATGAAVGAAGAGSKLALIVGGLAVAGAAGGFALGASGAVGGGGADGGANTPPPTAVAGARADAAAYFACSDGGGTGAALGDLHRGDEVWVIGRSGEDWLVIRNPQQLTSPAWMPTADLLPGGDTSSLPELTCSRAEDVAATVPDPTGTSTTVPADTSTTTTPTTEVSTTTTVPGTTVAPTTTPPDTTGPTVTISTDSPFLYSEGGAGCAGYLQQLTVTVSASDPSGATIGSVSWATPGGSGSASSLGGGLYRIGPVYSTHNGIVTMTITVQATDGVGNTTTRQTTIDFRQIADECIG